jgi:hypothetical protein
MECEGITEKVDFTNIVTCRVPSNGRHSIAGLGSFWNMFAYSSLRNGPFSHTENTL